MSIFLQSKQNAPNSSESWDVRWTALPRSRLTNSLPGPAAGGNGSDGLLCKTRFWALWPGFVNRS